MRANSGPIIVKILEKRQQAPTVDANVIIIIGTMGRSGRQPAECWTLEERCEVTYGSKVFLRELEMRFRTAAGVLLQWSGMWSPVTACHQIKQFKDG